MIWANICGLMENNCLLFVCLSPLPLERERQPLRSKQGEEKNTFACIQVNPGHPPSDRFHNSYTLKQKLKDEVKASHILVKHSGSRNPSSWREAKITLSLDDAKALIKSKGFPEGRMGVRQTAFFYLVHMTVYKDFPGTLLSFSIGLLVPLLPCNSRKLKGGAKVD